MPWSLLFDLVSEQRKRQTQVLVKLSGFLQVVKENHFTSQPALWWPELGASCVYFYQKTLLPEAAPGNVLRRL